MTGGLPGSAVYEGADLEALSVLRNYRRWIMARFRPFVAGDVVEIGAGIGTFSEMLAPLARSLAIVEPSPALSPALAARFAGTQGVDVHAAGLEDWLARAGPASADTVVMINVLEHIEDDAAALAGLHAALRPGGHLLLYGPALRWLYGEIDRVHGHFRRYHLDELRGRAAAAGFDVLSARYFDFLGVLPWWLINTKGGATAFNPRAADVYDRIGVPLTRALETLIPPPVGKNLIAVLKRR